MGATRKQAAKAAGLLGKQFATLCNNLGVEFKALPNGEPDIYDGATWAHIGLKLALERLEFRPKRHRGRRRGRQRNPVDLKILAYAEKQQKLQPKPNDYWLKKDIHEAQRKGELPPRERTTDIKRLRNLRKEKSAEQDLLRQIQAWWFLEGAPKLPWPKLSWPPESVGLLGPLGVKLAPLIRSRDF